MVSPFCDEPELVNQIIAADAPWPALKRARPAKRSMSGKDSKRPRTMPIRWLA
jgi:hypothetical protein